METELGCIAETTPQVPQKPLPGPRADLDRLDREAEQWARKIELFQKRAETPMERSRRRLKSYATMGRNWVRNFWRARQGRQDYLPLYFIWTVLRTCNFSCSYCDDHQGRKYPDLDNSDVLDTANAKRLLEIMRTATPAVYYAGGEPTLRNDLPELMAHARGLGFFPQVINTNASVLHKRLMQPGWENLLSDVDILIVSLDSLRPSVLGPMYKTQRPEQVILNLLILHKLSRKYGFKLMVNCVIQPGLVGEAMDVLDFANERGIPFCGVPQNVGPAVIGGILEDKEYQGFVKKLLGRLREGKRFAGSFRMNERLYQGLKLNCRNTLKPHVDFDGHLFWPCKAALKTKPAKIQVLDHPDIDSIWKTGSALIDPTGFHGSGEKQCGSNCNWAQNYSTDTYEHGLKHPLSMVRDVMDFLRQ